MLTILENSCWATRKVRPPKSNELFEYSRDRSKAEFKVLPKRPVFSFVVDPKIRVKFQQVWLGGIQNKSRILSELFFSFLLMFATHHRALSRHLIIRYLQHKQGQTILGHPQTESHTIHAQLSCLHRP